MNKEFEVHILDSEGIEKAQKIALAFDNLLNTLDPLVGISGRYPALVRTKLEEAAFFAKKAMAIQPENQRQRGSGTING
jgi:hypothetical protein